MQTQKLTINSSLKKINGKIKTLRRHNILCRKFATWCSAYFCNPRRWRRLRL